MIVDYDKIPRDISLPERVSCSACMITFQSDNGDIDTFKIPSIRHFDQYTRSHIEIIMEALNSRNGQTWSIVHEKTIQGFLTNRGRFLNRKEAYQMARENNQIIRRVGGDIDQLFSENLY